jgi:DNA-binding CsgD family transcriptional regulator
LSAEAERFRIFEDVSHFLLRLMDPSPGVVFLLDDLHWADRSTLQLLLHLIRKSAGMRLLVLVAYRSDDVELAGPLASMLADMARERLDQRLTLGRFSQDETADLIVGIGGAKPAPDVLREVHGRTDGNPFFIEEVVRVLQSEGVDLSSAGAARGWAVPAGISEVINQRLSHLTPDARRFLQSAAVIGEGFSVQMARRMSELADDAAVDAMEEAAGAGVLREDEARYVFAHPLIREVVYRDLSLARKQQLHARLAEALQERRLDAGDEGLAAIGHHWRLGGRPEQAVEFLLRAGDAAISLTAWTEAAGHWLAAAECMEQAGYPPRRYARLLEGIGDLHFLSRFEVHECIPFYERARALYESAGDELGAARARSRAGRSLAYPTSGFDFVAAIENLREAEKVLCNEPDCLELGELYAALAHAETHQLLTNVEDVLQAISRLEKLAEELDNEYLRVIAHSLRGHHLGLQGNLAEGLALEEMASSMARSFKSPAVNQWPERWREFLASYSSEEDLIDPRDAGSLQASMGIQGLYRPMLSNLAANCCGLQHLEILDPVKARTQHELCRNLQGSNVSPFLYFDLFLAGDISALREAVAGRPAGLAPVNNIPAFTAAFLFWWEGRWEEADRELTPTVLFKASNSTFILTSRWLLRLHRVMGRAGEDMAELEESLQKVTRFGAVKSELPCRAELAIACVARGRLDEAEQHLLRCREVQAKGEDWRGIAGRIALAEAVYASALRRNEDAESHFEHAVEVFRSMSLPWDEAETYELWARSGAKFLRGRYRQALVAEKLGRARAVYERLGAGQPWLDRLQIEAQQLVSNADARPTNPDGLTDREIEVLRLLAGGGSNREIADRLVLSVRTVERHITNIYAKIGARGKADATAYALRNSLT